MKLTLKEQEICDKYRAFDKSNRVHCNKCPLVISRAALMCYANIDGRTKEAKNLKRL